MRWLKHIFLALVMFSLFFTGAAGEAFAEVETPVVLQLKWHHQFQFAGYYMALEKGYFREEGLEVSIAAGGPGILPDEEVLSGRAEFGVLGSELIGKRVEGKPLCLVAVIFQHSVRALFVDKSSDLFSPGDLAGKPIMLNTNEQTEFLAMFQSEGISPEKLKVLEKDGSAIAKLMSGKIFAMNGSIANQPLTLLSKGFPVRSIRPVGYGIDFYGDSLFTTSEFADSSPDTVAAFRRASIRGWAYAMGNVEETVELIRNHYNSGKSFEQLLFEAGALRKVILPGLVEIGHVNPDRVARIAEIYRDLSLLPPDYSLEGFIFQPEKRRYLKKLNRFLGALGGVVLLAFLVGGGLVLFNRSLKTQVRNRTRKLGLMNTELRAQVLSREIAEEKNRRLRLYLANIIDSMPSILIGVDSDGVITQWNREAHRKTGLSPKEACGGDLESVYPIMSGNMKRIRSTIDSRKSISEKRIRYKENGKTRYANLVIFPLLAGEGREAVIRVDDVTEMIRVHEKMIQNEKMMSVGGLAAGMAHEINNPLSGILQNIQVVKNRLSRRIPKNEAAAESCGLSMDKLMAYAELRGLPPMLDAIQDSGRRAADIVENMLGFCRQGGGGFRTVDLADLMEKTLDLLIASYDLKKNYDFKTVEIIREFDKNLPLVSCDRGKIQQVLLNLMMNSAEAMHDAGTENPRLLLRLYGNSGMVCMEIQDNGPGMEEEVKKRIFEPFFTTKPTGMGTGLGLAISYFIITDNHKGVMEVISEPGEGARFIIKIPMDECPV